MYAKTMGLWSNGDTARAEYIYFVCFLIHGALFTASTLKWIWNCSWLENLNEIYMQISFFGCDSFHSHSGTPNATRSYSFFLSFLMHFIHFHFVVRFQLMKIQIYVPKVTLFPMVRYPKVFDMRPPSDMIVKRKEINFCIYYFVRRDFFSSHRTVLPNVFPILRVYALCGCSAGQIVSVWRTMNAPNMCT